MIRRSGSEITQLPYGRSIVCAKGLIACVLHNGGQYANAPTLDAPHLDPNPFHYGGKTLFINHFIVGSGMFANAAKGLDKLFELSLMALLI